MYVRPSKVRRRHTALSEKFEFLSRGWGRLSPAPTHTLDPPLCMVLLIRASLVGLRVAAVG